LNAAELQQVVDEWAPLVGAPVQKAYVPQDGVLLLELRVPGHSLLARFDTAPGETRLGLVDARPVSPPDALSFQQLVRAHLVGRQLVRMEKAPGDRVVRFTFADKEGERVLVAELLGRTGLLLLCAASGAILGLTGAVPPGRELRPGKVYAAPALLKPELLPSRFTAGPDFAVSRAIAAAYATRQQTVGATDLRAQLQKPLRAKLTKLTRTIAKVEAEALRTDAAESHRQAGELLKSNLHRVVRGVGEVVLTSYDTGEAVPVTVQLKPELSPADNLAWHFHQYRRLLSGSGKAKARLAQLQDEKAQLEAELAQVATQDLAALEARALAQAAPAPVRRIEKVIKQTGKKPFREFLSAAGKRIWVGKGASENDTLSFKLTRPFDLWLHARGLTGAHVVVPLERTEQVLPEVLLDACALAVHFSSAKGQGHVEVSYLPAKYLRKPKHARPGQVIYSQEKTLRYAHQPDRIARLLASREE
jgi:predicted ribosome quality control (RQC) complex YloA/Tae2 family protein